MGEDPLARRDVPESVAVVEDGGRDEGQGEKQQCRSSGREFDAAGGSNGREAGQQSDFGGRSREGHGVPGRAGIPPA